MNRLDEITGFVDSLVRAQMPNDRLLNIYNHPMRRRNLVTWMMRPPGREPTALFVGEAPGRYGAATTGVPFASIDILASSNSMNRSSCTETDVGLFYLQTDDYSVTREATASHFWRGVFDSLIRRPLPITWNVVPFWPVKTSESGSLSNRKPTASEISFGSTWLTRFVGFYPDAKVVAVGRTAEGALSSLDIEHFAVRHPSHGGSKEFAAGVKRVAQSMDSTKIDA